MLNAKKKKINVSPIFLGTRKLLSLILPNTHLKMDDTVITPSTSVKKKIRHIAYFDNYLMFDVHISELTKKIHSIIMFINRFKEFFNKSIRLTVAQSLVLSIINYGVSVRGATSNT